MKYTAITIGPIIKSLGLAHKTREIWAASYFFSLLMEKIIENIDKNNSIILPYPDKKELIEELDIDSTKIKSAGIFPDRLLLESENGLFSEMETAVKKAIGELKTIFGFTCDDNQLANYISTHIIEFEYIARDLGVDKEGNAKKDNIIFQTNDYLANCELQANYKAEDDECFLKMFEGVVKTKEFYKTKFKNGFPSIPEIATKGLNTKDIKFSEDIEDDNDMWQKLKELNGGELKTNKKYIAIIQADGDSIGEIIKQVAEQGSQQIRGFSKALSSFSLLAAQEIANYDGVPVYTGGDDLLFFAPVTNKDDNVFALIERLDVIFKEQVTDEFYTDKKPTMSYGVSISYYKFPMHEALNTARKLLFEKAKKKPKNAISFKVQKHSGQIFEAVLTKNFDEEGLNMGLDTKFLDLLNKNEGLVINSILHNFEKHKILLKQSLNSNPKTNLDNFFKNFYNEDIHKKSEDFINDVKELLNESYNGDFEKTINQIKAQLSIIKFLNDNKDE